MAMLLGAARMLQLQHESSEDGGGLTGTVKLVFQPFEEGGAGADLMIKTGEWGGRERVCRAPPGMDRGVGQQ